MPPREVGSAASRGHRVKAHFEADIIVEFEDELLDYGSVTQAVQDAIGHTGAVVDDVTEWAAMSIQAS